MITFWVVCSLIVAALALASDGLDKDQLPSNIMCVIFGPFVLLLYLLVLLFIGIFRWKL